MTKSARQIADSPARHAVGVAVAREWAGDSIANNAASLCAELSRLGRLPPSFDGRQLIPLANHESGKVRYLAVKNIGKLADENYLALLCKIADGEESTMVRREAVSAVGRMRSEKAISAMIRYSRDSDPKVVLQAIRGLLVFKKKTLVAKTLKDLEHHPNELVREVIESEFTYIFDSRESRQAHCDFPPPMQNAVVQGDVSEVLKNVPDDSVHLTFTSPPYYNARDYAIYPSYEKYLGFLKGIFRQVHRITKDGRFFILNTSPIIIPRVSRQHSSRRYPIPFDIHPHLIEMGWEFIDDIVWVKPEASVKNRNGGFLQHRKPLAYKPNARTEYLMVYRKKTNKLIDWNLRQYDYSAIGKSLVKGDYETSNVWRIDPVFDKTHTAVFPLTLCHRVVRYYSLAGDLVFDPFGGRGTFGRAAIELSRNFFMTEIMPEYTARMKETLAKGGQFFSPAPRFFSLAEFKREMKESQ